MSSFSKINRKEKFGTETFPENKGPVFTASSFGKATISLRVRDGQVRYEVLKKTLRVFKQD